HPQAAKNLRKSEAAGLGQDWPARFAPVKLGTDSPARHFKSETVLQVHPELSGGAEKDTEPQRGVGRDAGLLVAQSLDPSPWHVELGRQRVGGQAQRLQELLAEHLARMQRGQLLHGVLLLSGSQ